MFTDDFFAIDVLIYNIEVINLCIPSAPRAGFYVQYHFGFFFFFYVQQNIEKHVFTRVPR